ncbi:MAG: DUF3568 domain-containing protein [Opitutaceae bacterium]|jgi:hypothetical protein|nr:DUF3568 domain-containing protein [Opitutaceae bacterium]
MQPRAFFRASAAVLCALVFCVQSGCVLVAVGAAAGGTVAYVRGDLEATLPAGYERSLRATQAGVRRMQYSLVSERSDAISGQFIARTAMDKKIDVMVTKDGDATTLIRIRVGVFGDEKISRALLDAIKASL